jgi:hypothetical protein
MLYAETLTDNANKMENKKGVHKNFPDLPIDAYILNPEGTIHTHGRKYEQPNGT